MFFWNMPKGILEKFSHIIVEFHFWDQFMIDFLKLKKILKKINKTHQSYHVHITNCVNFLQAIEVSYLIKKGNKFEIDDSIYPIKDLDIGCTFKDDILIGQIGLINY